jgi:hypothetical protein
MSMLYASNWAGNPTSTKSQFEYVYRPYETGTISYSHDRTSVSIRVEIDEESSLATMIASESLLARDWDTPEEDEAWADL